MAARAPVRNASADLDSPETPAKKVKQITIFVSKRLVHEVHHNNSDNVFRILNISDPLWCFVALRSHKLSQEYTQITMITFFGSKDYSWN